MWPWSRIRELTQMLEAEQALNAALYAENDRLHAESAALRDRIKHFTSAISATNAALIMIKGMRTPKANGTVVRMAKVAEDALK